MTDRKILSILDDDWRPPPDANGLAKTIELRLGEAPTALERAAALAAWKKLWELRHPNRRNGGDRRSEGFRRQKPDSKNWNLIAADRLKLAPSTVFADVQLASKLGLSDIARLWDSPICNDGSALRTFAALPPPQRDKVFRLLRPGRSWEDVLRDARLKAERESEDASFDRLYSAWSNAPARVRRRFLAQIGVEKRLIDAVMQPRKAGGGRA